MLRRTLVPDPGPAPPISHGTKVWGTTMSLAHAGQTDDRHDLGTDTVRLEISV